MEPGIRGHGEFVYQYVGDEIMALFKLEEDRYTDNAVQAAVTIQSRLLVNYNEGRKKEPSPTAMQGSSVKPRALRS